MRGRDLQRMTPRRPHSLHRNSPRGLKSEFRTRTALQTSDTSRNEPPRNRRPVCHHRLPPTPPLSIAPSPLCTTPSGTRLHVHKLPTTFCSITAMSFGSQRHWLARVNHDQATIGQFVFIAFLQANSSRMELVIFTWLSRYRVMATELRWKSGFGANMLLYVLLLFLYVLSYLPVCC